MALDLSRIEAWTREMLEAEARRRRIRGPEFRTRSELVRLILKHQYGDWLAAGRERIAKGVRAVEQARELLAGVVGGALSALPEPMDTLLRLRARLPGARPRGERPGATEWARVEPARVEPARGEPASVEPAPVEPARVESASVEPARGEPARMESARVEPVRGEPARVEHARVEHAEPPRGEPPAVQPPAGADDPVARAPVPPAPGAPRPSTRTFVEEPIRTHSMARLLAAQGHRERALAIYEELLAQNSEDEALRREAEAVRRGQPIDPPSLPDPPGGLERAALPEPADLLLCDGTLTTGLHVRWQITDDGLRRARAVLGRDGDLAVRVVTIQPDPVQVVRSEITEHGPVAVTGTWQAPPLPDAARCFVALGLRHGDRFVAIVHGHPPAVPAGRSPEPTPQLAAG